MIKNTILLFLSIAVGVLILKVFDHVFLSKQTVIFGGHYERTEDAVVSQKEIYPYTGGHTRPDFFLNPNFSTGDHGFMVNFDLDRPPAKEPGEFRMIVTGGSGAAGWGANRSDAFMSSVLERLFATEASCRSERRLRVINLAMGGSQSYQNYIALNKWGHGVEPDLILTYSGFNDMNVPWFTAGDGYRDFEVLLAFNRIARYSESPDWLKALGRFFPGLVRETSLGLAIRSLNVKREASVAQEDYRSRFPAVEREPNAIVEQLVIPQYVHALQSIKRDFQGIPVVVAYQPYALAEESATFRGFFDNQSQEVVEFNKAFRLDVATGVEDYLSLYERFISETRSRLGGYVNDKWLFLNPHAYVRNELLGIEELGDGIHFNNDVQAMIAAHIADPLFEFICSLE